MGGQSESPPERAPTALPELLTMLFSAEAAAKAPGKPVIALEWDPA